MNTSSLMHQLRRLFSRKKSQQKKPQRERHLRLMQLEDRRVLNASFALTPGVDLTLNSFDAGDGGLTVSMQNVMIDGAATDAYVFELDANTWDGDPMLAADGIEVSGTQLRIAQSLFDSPVGDNTDIVIDDDLATDPAVTLASNVQTFGGDFTATGVASFGASTFNLTTSGNDTDEAAGAVTITAVGDITFTTGDIITAGVADNGVGGNVNLTTSDGDIVVDQINANGFGTGAGGNIMLTANDAPVLDAVANGSITLNGMMQTNNDATVTLDADNSVQINANITALGTGAVSVTANADLVADGGTESITMAPGTVIDAGSGTILLTNDNDDASGDDDFGGDITAHTLVTTNNTATAIVINSDASVQLNHSITTSGGGVDIDADVNITTAADGDIETTGNIANEDSGDVTMDAGGNISLGGHIHTAGFNNAASAADSDAGTITLTTVNGNITTLAGATLNAVGGDNNDVDTSPNGEGGLITLDANDAAALEANVGDITIGDSIMTSTQLAHPVRVQLDAQEDVAVNASISTLRGSLTLIAGDTAANVAITAAIQTLGGNVVIDAGNNVTSTAAGTITTTAAANSGLASGSVTIRSAIGGTPANTGEINLTGAVDTRGVSAIPTFTNIVGGAGGAITLTATANAGGAVTAASLQSSGGGGGNSGSNGGDAGAIDINADGIVTLTTVAASGGGSATGNGGAAAAVNVNAGGMIAVTNITASGGNPSLFVRAGGAAGNIVLDNSGSGANVTIAGQLQTIGGIGTGGGANGADGAVLITSGAAILDTSGDETANIRAGSAALRAQSGIGQDAADDANTNGQDIDTQAGTAGTFTLAAVTETGDINIRNSGNLLVSTVNALVGVTISDTADANNGNDNITLIAASPLQVNAAVIDNAGGNILLAAEGNANGTVGAFNAADDDLQINANITATGGNGNISLFAGGDVLQTTGTISAAGAGNVNLSAGEDYNSGTNQAGNAAADVIMTTGTVAQSATGLVEIEATRNVALSSVSTGGNVTVSADDNDFALSNNAGAITDNNAAATNITAATATLTAATGIGAADDIETDVTNLTVDNTSVGNVQIAEVSGITFVTNVRNQAAGGTLSVVTTNGSIDTAAATTSSSNGNLTLDANGAAADVTVGAGGVSSNGALIDIDADRNIALNGGVNAAAGNVQLTADSDASSDGAITRTAGTVSATSAVLQAATGIGSGGSILTAATNIQFNNSTSGQTNISNAGALTINGVSDFGDGGTVSAASPLVVAANVTSAADFILEAAGSAANNDDLTINANVTHTGLAGVAKSIILRADDDVVFQSGLVSFTNTNAGDVLTVQADSAAVPNPDASLTGDIQFSGGTVNVGSGTASFSTNTTAGGGAILGNVAAVTDVTAGNAVFTAAGNIGATNAIQTSSGTLTFNSGGAVSISENNTLVVTGSNTALSLALTAEAGSITDDATADITVTNNASFTANGAGGAITLGDVAANNDSFGTLTFNSVGAVNISEDNATVIAGANTALSLALTAEAGSITDDATADITVTNNASFTANGAGGAITLGDVAANNDSFGTLTFNSTGAVNISEDNAMVVTGVNTAQSLALTAEAGSITDDATADITVTNNASFTANGAGGAITLGDVAANNDSFGTLTFNSTGAVNISEDNATVIAGANTAQSLALTAEAGSITDDAAADITVTNNASFTANGAGGTITLGDIAANNDSFGTLTFNSVGAVNISEDNATVIAGANTALSLVLTAEAGSITDDATADITVTNNASFTANGAGGAITLGDVAANNDSFGTLTFNSTGAVSISEDNAMVVTGVNTAQSLALTAEAGSITDDATADITVTNNASFTANGAGGAITLGDVAANNDSFGTLTFNSTGAVNISEDNATVIAGANTAQSLALTAEAGSITDDAAADITVTNNASFTANGAGGTITLGDIAANNDSFGTLTFNSVGAVNISEDNATVIAGANTALSLVLTAEAGSITDDATADITVTNNASFTANGAGGAITLGDVAANNDSFGTLTFNSTGAVSISEDNAMVVTGVNTAQSLALTAEAGSITDDATADITVTNNASFTANGAGGAITLGDVAANNDSFGTLTFNSVGAVNISEDNATVIAGANTALSLALTAEAGSITDDATADITVTNNASFTANGAGGAITLGDVAANNDSFGTLTFNSVGAVNISEDNATVIAGANTALSLALTAEAGSITDDATADITVTNNASFTANGAGGAITLGDVAANNDSFGTLTFNSVGAVNISEDNTLVVTGSNTALSLALTAEAGSITDDATADITVTNNASFTANGAGGAITLGDVAANNDSFGTLTFNSTGAVSISEDNAMVVTGVNTAQSLALTAEAGSITDDATADITVTNNASFTANGPGETITLGDVAANNDSFGTLTFNSTGAVNISEDNATVIAGANTAQSLALTAEAGSITDDAAADITVTNNASFTANGPGGAITLGDVAANDDSFGTLTFNSVGAVNISEDDSMVVTGANTGNGVILANEIANSDVTIQASGITSTAQINISSVGDITSNASANLITTNALANSGTVTLTATAAVDLNGNVVTAGADGNPGLDAGAVNITGTSVAVTNIDASGGNATGGSGGSGGNAATITLNATATNITLAGTIDSSGGIGDGAGVTGNGQTFAVTDPVVLEADSSVSTNGTASGNITFGSTINGTTAGGQDLTLTAGGGDVTLTGVVGGGTRVGDVTINSANNVTANAITAASLTQLTGTGTTTLNGAVDTNTVTGISIQTDVDITVHGDLSAIDPAASTDESITLRAGNDVTFMPTVTRVTTRDEIDINTGDTITINADTDGIGGGTVTFPAAAGFDILTDGGIANTFTERPPLLGPPAAFFLQSANPFAATTANATSDQLNFLSEYTVLIGNSGEENLRIDIDWRDPFSPGGMTGTTSTGNPITSDRLQTLYVNGNTVQVIGHNYTSFDFQQFITAGVPVFNVDFSVSHHDSIQVTGPMVTQSITQNVVNGLISSSDDPGTGTGVLDPGTNVTDLAASNIDLHFDTGLLRVVVPTILLFTPDPDPPPPEPPAAPVPPAPPEPVPFLTVSPVEPPETPLTSYSSQSEDYFQLRRTQTNEPVEGYEHIDDDIGWKLLQPRVLKKWIQQETNLNGAGYELWLITTKGKNGQDVTFERPVLKFDIFDQQPFPMEEDLGEELPELRLERLDVDEDGNIIDGDPKADTDAATDGGSPDQPQNPPNDDADQASLPPIFETVPVSRVDDTDHYLIRSTMAGLAVSSVLAGKHRPQGHSRQSSLVARLMQRINGQESTNE